MKRIFNYFDNQGWLNKIDIKVVAGNKEEAVELIWEYMGDSPRWNRKNMHKSSITVNTNEVILNESGILCDESTSSDLSGHFD